MNCENKVKKWQIAPRLKKIGECFIILLMVHFGLEKIWILINDYGRDFRETRKKKEILPTANLQARTNAMTRRRYFFTSASSEIPNR